MNYRIFLFVALAAGNATADDASVSTAGYHLKNRSSFDSAGATRPPFWPIGWVHQTKTQQQQVVVQAKLTLDPQMFSVTSILLGHPTLAVINGRAYSEGELLRAPRQKSSDAATKVAVSQAARIRVQKIDDGSVTLTSADQSVTVPLRRPELNEHKEDKDEQTLLSDG